MTDNRTKGGRAKDETEEKHGLICRNCGCRHFQVIYTRRTSKNRILRRRECRNCGRRITTYEKEN